MPFLSYQVPAAKPEAKTDLEVRKKIEQKKKPPKRPPRRHQSPLGMPCRPIRSVSPTRTSDSQDQLPPRRKTRLRPDSKRQKQNSFVVRQYAHQHVAAQSGGQGRSCRIALLESAFDRRSGRQSVPKFRPARFDLQLSVSKPTPTAQAASDPAEWKSPQKPPARPMEIEQLLFVNRNNPGTVIFCSTELVGETNMICTSH